jgi:hypothetical protein
LTTRSTAALDEPTPSNILRPSFAGGVSILALIPIVGVAQELAHSHTNARRGDNSISGDERRGRRNGLYLGCLLFGLSKGNGAAQGATNRPGNDGAVASTPNLNATIRTTCSATSARDPFAHSIRTSRLPLHGRAPRTPRTANHLRLYQPQQLSCMVTGSRTYNSCKHSCTHTHLINLNIQTHTRRTRPTSAGTHTRPRRVYFQHSPPKHNMARSIIHSNVASSSTSASSALSLFFSRQSLAMWPRLPHSKHRPR